MPTLQEISERAADAHERCVRTSIAMDMAYLADVRDFQNGGKFTRLHDLIDRMYADALGELDVHSGNGTNPGA